MEFEHRVNVKGSGGSVGGGVSLLVSGWLSPALNPDKLLEGEKRDLCPENPTPIAVNR